MRNIIIGVIGILIAASIFVVINNSRSTQKTVTPIPSKTVSVPTPVNEKHSTYNDSSGFAFQYPEGATVTKKNLQNNQMYASVALSMANQPETITVKAEETDLNNIDDWFKGSKKTSVFGSIQKIKLADLDARQFEANNAKTTVAIDQGVLFTLTTDAKKDSQLSKTYDSVIKSFAFVEPSQSVQPSSQGQSDNDSEAVVEEEEVIE